MAKISPALHAVAVNAFDLMHRKVNAGNFGPNVLVDPRWCGDDGFAAFAEWFAGYNPTYTAVVSKDLLGPSKVFSPETCVVVSRRFLNWLQRATTRYHLTELNGAYAVGFFSLRGAQSPNWWSTPEQAVNEWRDRMHSVIVYFKKQLDAGNPKIVPRLYEIVDEVIEGKEPIVYISRRDLRGR